VKRLLTSCFSLGLLPLCPGTWGSLPPAIIFMVLACLGLAAWLIFSVMMIFVVAGSVICVVCSPAVIAETGKKDPGQVVIDEFAGQAVTFLPAVLIIEMNPLIVAGMGFVFFRLFDIIKPFPVKKLEKLPKGWGILADDLMAGFYAAISLVIFVNFCQYYSKVYS